MEVLAEFRKEGKTVSILEMNAKKGNIQGVKIGYNLIYRNDGQNL